MRLLTFRDGTGLRLGVLDGERVIAAEAQLGPAFSSLRGVLAADALDALRAASEGVRGDLRLAELELALPVPDPGKILCVGRNYGAYHELAREARPRWPTVFARFVSSFAAHGEAIVRPRVSDQLDYEGELGVVIGRHGRHIPVDQALSHVAGYTIVNEGSVRDWQQRGKQNCPGKNFYRSGSMGPWMVTADEIADPMALQITTRVDGELRQHGNTRDMLFTIAEAIAHISIFTPLDPGDVIATGSPGGSAIEGDPPAWLRPGQALEVEIAGVGTLHNLVAAED